MERRLLDIVIPVFNGARWINGCVESVLDTLRFAGIQDAKIIIVDDGSTDNVAEVVREIGELSVEVLAQPNLGRVLARQNGANYATAMFVLFLDVRVRIHKESLRNILTYLNDPMTSVWTADVETQLTGNLIARFWYSIEHIFWRKYFKNRKLTQIVSENFDYVPKGTGALLIPRILFLDASAKISRNSIDATKINDDTALFREIVRQQPIMISPTYSCSYFARSNLQTFLSHANHRGSVLIDGHWRTDARLRIPITITLLVAPLLILIALVSPFLGTLLLLLAIGVGALVILVQGLGPLNAAVFSILFLPFSALYLLGMYKGVWLRIRTHLSTRCKPLP
jgi:glycosyltransferase involved in cell wall biosynthesis